MKGKINNAARGRYTELSKTTGSIKFEVTIDKNIAVTPKVTNMIFLFFNCCARKVLDHRDTKPINVYPIVVMPNTGINGPLTTDAIAPLGAKLATSFKTKRVSVKIETMAVHALNTFM